MDKDIDHKRNGIFAAMNLKFNSRSTICHELRKLDKDRLEQIFGEVKARQEIEGLLGS